MLLQKSEFFLYYILRLSALLRRFYQYIERKKYRVKLSSFPVDFFHPSADRHVRNLQSYQAVNSRKHEAVDVSLLNFSDIPMHRINHLENKVEFYNRLEILNSIYLHA